MLLFSFDASREYLGDRKYHRLFLKTMDLLWEVKFQCGTLYLRKYLGEDHRLYSTSVVVGGRGRNLFFIINGCYGEAKGRPMLTHKRLR